METPEYKVFAAARDGMAITLWAMLSDKPPSEVEKLLKVETSESEQRTTPFIIASRNGHEKVVRMLMTNFHLDIEQVGTVKFDGFIIDGATALWCAAGAGHDHVVQTLVGFGANVNHPTFSNSTPLRAACFDGRLDIVKYLIEHDSDIYIANKYNNTCLMIACYKGHGDVVRYLLEMGADTNTKAHCGATALHFASERGFVTIVQDLVLFGAQMQLNDQSMTPLHIAAESSQAQIVEFFITQSDCPKLSRVEALELLGASYANDKDNYNIEKCYHYLWLAMHERYLDPSNIIQKNILPPVDAYENRVECKNIQELEAIKDNHNALHMEALILRERILGEDNVENPHPIIFRGAVFADRSQFERCTSLWMRAMKLRFKNSRSISKDMLRFAQVFSQMIHLGVPVDFSLCEEIFEHCINELQSDELRITKAGNSEEREQAQEIYDYNIHSALYLLVILTKVKTNTAEFDLRVCKLAYRFNKLRLCLGSKKCSTPLHMVCDEQTLIDDFHVSDVVHFPSDTLVRLLLQCGADPNLVDSDGNTPLHTIVCYNRPISDFLTLHNTIMLLIDGGCHIDRANIDGETAMDSATTGVADIILRTRRQISLKCIAAHSVKKHKLSYQGQIPAHLEDFVAIH